MLINKINTAMNAFPLIIRIVKNKIAGMTCQKYKIKKYTKTTSLVVPLFLLKSANMIDIHSNKKMHINNHAKTLLTIKMTLKYTLVYFKLDIKI